MTYLYGKTFIKRILNNDRDFTGIILQPMFDFNKDSGLFKALYAYLKEYRNTFQANPLILDDVIMKGVQMSNLEIPYLQAESLDISESILRKVNFSNSHMPFLHIWDSKVDNCDFTKSVQTGANYCDSEVKLTKYKKANLDKIVCNPNTVFDNCIFEDSDMREVNASHVNFYRSNLQRLDVYKTDFYFSILEKADIKYLRNIKYSRNLHQAIFKETRMTVEEYAVVKALKELKELDLPLIEGKLISMPSELDKEFESLVERLEDTSAVPLNVPRRKSISLLENSFPHNEFISRVTKLPNQDGIDLDDEELGIEIKIEI